jgi:hypothetical protein
LKPPTAIGNMPCPHYAPPVLLMETPSSHSAAKKWSRICRESKEGEREIVLMEVDDPPRSSLNNSSSKALTIPWEPDIQPRLLKVMDDQYHREARITIRIQVQLSIII